MEAEYIAACKAAKEAVWLRKFFTDLEVVPDMDKPLVLYCDKDQDGAQPCGSFHKDAAFKDV